MILVLAAIRLMKSAVRDEMDDFGGSTRGLAAKMTAGARPGLPAAVLRGALCAVHLEH